MRIEFALLRKLANNVMADLMCECMSVQTDEQQDGACARFYSGNARKSFTLASLVTIRSLIVHV